MKWNKTFEFVKVFIVTDLVLFILVFVPALFKINCNNNYYTNAGDDPLEKLVQGKIAVSIADEMKYHQNYIAAASITASLNDSILFQDIDTNNINNVESIKVSSKMKVLLQDPSGENFSIRELTNSEQIVSKTDNTIWRWNVKPLKGGDNPLMVTASVIVTDKDGKGEKTIKVMEKTISISTPFMNSAIEFSKENWQYILSSILIPLGVYWYRERNKPKPKKYY